MKQSRPQRLDYRRPAACAVFLATASMLGCASPLEQRFQMHIDYLASDDLEGRGVGTRGIAMAADYIARQFAEIGLEPAGENGSYFQTLSTALRRDLTDASRLAFRGEAREQRVREDFIPFGFSSNESFSGDLVFCGYGIAADDHGHDDFKDLSLDGKVALMLRGEPEAWSDPDGGLSRHAMFRTKVYNVKDRGCVAVLIVNKRPAESESDKLVEFAGTRPGAFGIPAFHITRILADRLLARAGSHSLDQLQDKLDAGEPTSAHLAGVVVEGQAGLEEVTASTRNVLGMLRGRGPLADEVVIIGAHYDHLGIRKPMMRSFKGGRTVTTNEEPRIHNGADDNASGTSGLIEIARLMASKRRCQRSLLFIAFTAEETGLLGSKHYVRHPSVPLEQTVAMLNMDMIGRMKPGTDRVLVFGVDSATGLKEILDRAARRVGLDTGPSDDTGGRSDHAPFIRREIPAMHFFSGHHRDYHKPGDDSEKINKKDGARVLRLVYHMAEELATRADRPRFQAGNKPERVRSADQAPSYRVVMGIAPGYADDGTPGMSVDMVTTEGPADVAGMKPGDHIIRIGGKPVANIYDYMAATRNNNPGDTVEVVVMRDDTEVTLKVTLASTR